MNPNQEEIQELEETLKNPPLVPNTPQRHLSQALNQFFFVEAKHPPHPTLEHSYAIIDEECEELKQCLRMHDVNLSNAYQECLDIIVACLRCMVAHDLENRGNITGTEMYLEHLKDPTKHQHIKFGPAYR